VVLKNAKQCFFMPTPSKKAKKMPSYDVHVKHHFFMPNHFQKVQVFGIRSEKCQPGNRSLANDLTSSLSALLPLICLSYTSAHAYKRVTMENSDVEVRSHPPQLTCTQDIKQSILHLQISPLFFFKVSLMHFSTSSA